jgi:hypothetical protein
MRTSSRRMKMTRWKLLGLLILGSMLLSTGVAEAGVSYDTVRAWNYLYVGSAYDTPGTEKFTVNRLGEMSQTIARTSQTTETYAYAVDFDTDSTYLTGASMGYSGGYGSSAIDVTGDFSGVNGGYSGLLIRLDNSAAHTADGAGVTGIKSVVTNDTAMADGNIWGGLFIAKHTHATNDMAKSATLIGIEGWAYPANVGFVGTLLGGNFGYHIEATTENFPSGSVARGLQIFCDDASSNTDPTEETALELWNLAGDQDNAIQITHSGSGFTYLIATQSVDGCFSADTGSPAATTTHKIKVNMNGTVGYIPVYADY